MALDSKALFKRKLTESGVSDATVEKMMGKGWTSLGSFAFCCSSSPSSDPGNDAVFEKLAKELVDDKEAELPGLRRLYFEAWVTASSELKQRLERRDDDPPRRMPTIEKAERKTELKKLLGKGLKLENDAEPSDSLIDAAWEIHEGEQVRRIPWEKCTSRNAETENEKFVKDLKTDRDGFMRVTQMPADVMADTSTILKVGDVLVRRGAALHISRVMSWELHQTIASEIMSALKAEVEEGFLKVTLEQAKSYDVAIWRKLNELAGGRVRQSAPGISEVLPLDELLPKVLNDPKIIAHLMPRQAATRAGSSSDSADKVARLERRIAEMCVQMQASRRAAGGPSNQQALQNAAQQGPPSKKQKRGRGFPSVPGLEGMRPKDANGANICFGYNLGTCNKAQQGQKCPKGLHICGKCLKPDCARTYRACRAQ